jgi:hypothetical protein
VNCLSVLGTWGISVPLPIVIQMRDLQIDWNNMKRKFMRTNVGYLLAACAIASLATQAAISATTWPGPQGDTYASIMKLPDWSGTWAKPDHPPMPRGHKDPAFDPPYRASYADEVQKAKTAKGNAEMCLPGGMPGIMSVPLGYEFLMTPGRVTILVEEGPTIRRVFTDGRGHPDDPEPTFSGDSIGHWEGDTLVVDTVGIKPKAQFLMGVKTTGKTHVIERIHLVDHDHMVVDTVVEDPIALTGPWHYQLAYVRSKTAFLESYYCDDDRDSNGEPDLTLPPATH